MKKWVWGIFEGIVGFVIWSFLGWWLAGFFLRLTEASVKYARETRIAILLSTAGVVGLVSAAVYARRALDAHEGRGKPGRAALIGRGGKPEITLRSALVFSAFALAWAYWLFIIQSWGRH
jgi:hypothetical protein